MHGATSLKILRAVKEHEAGLCMLLEYVTTRLQTRASHMQWLLGITPAYRAPRPVPWQ